MQRKLKQNIFIIFRDLSLYFENAFELDDILFQTISGNE